MHRNTVLTHKAQSFQTLDRHARFNPLTTLCGYGRPPRASGEFDKKGAAAVTGLPATAAAATALGEVPIPCV